MQPNGSLRFTLLLVLGTFYYQNICSQRVSAHQFTTDEGLPSMTIYRMLQAPDGRIWLGTDQGLSRFDGHRFENFGPEHGLPGREVIAMCLDREGHLWVGTFAGGLARFRSGRFETHAEVPWIPELKGVPTALLALQQGNMAVATESELYLFGPQNHPAQILATCSRGGRTFFDHPLRGLSLLQSDLCYGPPADAFSDAPHELIGFPPQWPYFADQSHSGTTSWEQLRQLQQEAGFIRRSFQVLDEQYPGNHVLTYILDQQQNLWVGLEGIGLVRVHHQDRKASLIYPRISTNSLICDRAGNIWCGSNQAGLILIRKAEMETYTLGTQHGLLENEVQGMDLHPQLGLLFTYPSGGFSCLSLKTGSFSHSPPLHLRTSNRLNMIRSLGKNGLLISFGRNICWLFQIPRAIPTIIQGKAWGKTKEIRIQRQPGNDLMYAFLPGFAVKDIWVRSDSLWAIATNVGIVECHLTADELYCLNTLPQRTETIVGSPDGSTLWASTMDSLMVKRKGEWQGLFSLSDLGSRITHLVPDGNEGLWLGTATQGLVYLGKDYACHLTTRNGLISNVCTTLHLGQDNLLWVGTEKGLMSIQSPVGPHHRPDIRVYNRKTGLPGNVILDLAHTGDTIWVANRAGLSHFVPGSESPSHSPVRIALEAVQIQGRDTVVQTAYTLPDWQNSFVLHFYDSTLAADGFQYRCLGVDSLWRNLAQPKIELPFLAPGHDYQVEMRGRIGNGPWSPSAKVVFSIRQAFFRRPTFYLLSGVLILGVGMLILSYRHRNRVRITRQREAFLQEISKVRLSALQARMNPHFIFNSLNSIQHLVLEEDERSTIEFISKFSKLMRAILDHSMYDFISLQDELEMCRLYLETESLRLEHNFEYAIQVDPALNLHRTQLPTMAIQPFLENAIWHGLMPKKGPRRLQFSLALAGDRLIATIEDNGIGREAAAQIQARRKRIHQAHASQILTQRLHLLNQSYTEAPFRHAYQDLFDPQGHACGTRVVLQFPLASHASTISNVSTL